MTAGFLIPRGLLQGTRLLNRRVALRRIGEIDGAGNNDHETFTPFKKLE
jgi:hypothetical protein